MSGAELGQLRRVRWAVRAVLLLGVAASVTANVLHARPHLVSQAIAAWPPVALLLTVELTSRIPMHRRGLAATRVGANVVIAAIAAWVSYWHMQDVAVRFGETPSSAYLLPISVDGLVVVASICLVELAARLDTSAHSASTTPPAPPPPMAPAEPTAPATPAPAGRPRPRRGGAAKRQPSAAVSIARQVARTPEAPDAMIAARLGLSEATVRRHRRQPVDSVSTAPDHATATPPRRSDPPPPTPHFDLAHV